MSDLPEDFEGPDFAGDGRLAAFAPCFMCKQPFLFDPDTVISILIDPVSGLSPELGGDPQRALRQPIDPDCVRLAAAQRQRRGLPPHRLPDGRPAT